MLPEITEVERATCAILDNAIRHNYIANPAIYDWVRRLLADPAHVEYCPKGAHPNASSYEHTFDYKAAFGTPTTPTDQAAARRWARIAQLTDQAICNLAGALACYRADNRPTGDVVHHLSREAGDEGYTGIVITTSLAAAVAEYVDELLNARMQE